MAHRLNSLIKPIGTAAIFAVVLVTFVPVLALFAHGGGLFQGRFDISITEADFAAIRFTLLQATLSAFFSVCFAIPVARGLFWRRFRGRDFLITALGAPFLLPVIVAVLGLITVWGRSGWVNSALENLGIGTLNIYGLLGVLLAHVFFNLPLAVRLFLQSLSQIPTEHFRIAEQMGMSRFSQFRVLEWPILVSQIAGIFLLVFLICMTSFAVVLALGGGPKATTLELAIYESVQFDFDLKRAALLAILQFLMASSLGLLILGKSQNFSFGVGLYNVGPESFGHGWLSSTLDTIAIAFLVVLLGLPLLAIISDGIQQIAVLPPTIWMSLVNSIAISLTSTSISLALGLALSATIACRSGKQAESAELFGMLVLAASPLVIGTGLFIILQPFVLPTTMALPVTALVNSTMSLPFVVRILLPAQRRAMMLYGPVEDSLGIKGVSSLRLVYWPCLRAPIGFAAGISAALSMGDLGVIALFAPPDFATLPLHVYRLMGSYRTDLADGAALLLVISSFLLFLLFDQGGRSGRMA